MAREAETPPVFRREWVEQVKEIIDSKKSIANVGKIPRVANSLLETKPEAYIPHFVSLGPYHHWKLEKKIAASSSAGGSYEYSDLKMSIGEAYKAQSMVTIKGILDNIVEKIKGMRQEIEDFYGWPISTDGEYPQHFALKMAIDSSFLLRFFGHLISESDDMRYLNRFQFCIKCDILKLENQIPLPVLRNVFDIGKEALYDLKDIRKKALTDVVAEGFGKLLQDTYKKLSPFDQFNIANYDINGQPHLLGCMHALVWPSVKLIIVQPLQVRSRGESSCASGIRSAANDILTNLVIEFAMLSARILSKWLGKRRRSDILKPFNAKGLKNGGIKFKSTCWSQSFETRFEPRSGTLYLPRITISEMETEVFFRNMLALEFNDAHRGEYVTRYVGLMHFLIATPDDVRLLRESDIIDRRSPMLCDEDIARMWKSMCHPFFTGHLEPSDELLEALTEVLDRKYYLSLVRKALWEVYWDHLSKPGKGLAVVAGALILALTFAQTFFAWWDWSHTYHKH